MEIIQEFKSAPRPNIGSLKPGDVFLLEEKDLSGEYREAYMRLQAHSVDSAWDATEVVVRLSDATLVPLRVSRQVIPVKAVLTLEVPFG